MKHFILFNSLIFITVCPVNAIPTIAYESTSVANNVFDDMWWEGDEYFKTEWTHQPVDSMIYSQASMDVESAAALLAASIEDLELGNSTSQNLQYKNDYWLNKGAGNSYNNLKPFDSKFAPGLLNRVAINARPYWVASNEFNHANNNALGVVSYSPPVAPTPGAILLGSMGVGVVGWLHRRKRL